MDIKRRKTRTKLPDLKLNNQPIDRIEDKKKSNILVPITQVVSENKPVSEEITKITQGVGLNIVPLPSNKIKVYQRPIMRENIIPQHPSRCIFNGKSSSGKTTLITNLLVRPEFYGKILDPESKKYKHYFDEIYLISPTSEMDDLVKYLDIPPGRIYTKFSEKTVNSILDEQKNKVTSMGIDKAPKILILMDDIQADEKFLRSEPLLRLFLTGRHYGISVWIASQSFTKTPRACRLQASNIFMFPCSLSESDLLSDEFTPPGYSKKEFELMIAYCTKDPHNFMHINTFDEFATRYRHNLDEKLRLTKKIG